VEWEVQEHDPWDLLAKIHVNVKRQKRKAKNEVNDFIYLK